ncbi:hypothetical protein [Sulfitobacter sp. SK012]|uniref:hypothetical protein n=1 Tax=Sulfitobacter sp. SK012 TaxID=1389005 RepID=UPI0013B3FBB9|nr:hypothetical protein [Sulfitobacter sp. SK012]
MSWSPRPDDPLSAIRENSHLARTAVIGRDCSERLDTDLAFFDWQAQDRLLETSREVLDTQRRFDLALGSEPVG